MKFSIVIPARNEAGNIGATLDEICERLDNEHINFEAIVVNDGSVDSTNDEVENRVKRDTRILLINNEEPHGFGYAVRCGLKLFTGDAVVIMMADGSDNPADIVKYYYILRDSAECVFGSRFISGGRIEQYPYLKLAVNRFANLFIRILFGLRYNDITNAFKGYRSYVIKGCKPFLSPHFNLTVELPLKAIVRGYSYEVTPISWRGRKHGTSQLKIKEMGSRYLYIVLNILLEKFLTKKDYSRPQGDIFQSWPWKG